MKVFFLLRVYQVLKTEANEDFVNLVRRFERIKV